MSSTARSPSRPGLTTLDAFQLLTGDAVLSTAQMHGQAYMGGNSLRAVEPF